MSERCQTKLTEKFDNKNYIIYFGILCTAIAILYFYRFHFAIIAFSYGLGCLACYYGLNSSILLEYLVRLKCHYVGETLKDEEVAPVRGCETCGSKECLRHDSSVLEPWAGLQIHKQLDQAIEDFYNSILDQFINSWYSKITLQPFFVDELRYQLRYASACLLQRAVKINYAQFIINRLVPCALRHYSACSPDALDSKMAVHPAAANRNAELKYLRSITNAIMPYLLKNSEVQNSVFRVLIREIFAGWVLLSLTDVLADPYILNTLILLATGDETMAQLPSTPNYKVEFLETFVRQTESIYSQRSKLLRVELDLVISQQEQFYAFMQFMKTTSHIHLLQFYNDIKTFQTKILNPDLDKAEEEYLQGEARAMYSTYLSEAHHLPIMGELAEELQQLLQQPTSITKFQTSRAIYQAARQSHALLEKLWLPKFLHSEEFYKLLIGSRIPAGYQKQMVKKSHDKLLNTALKLGHRLKGALRSQTVDGQVLENFNCEDSEGDGVDNMDILKYLDNLAIEESLRGQDLSTYKVVLTDVETKLLAGPRRGPVRVFSLCAQTVHSAQQEPALWTLQRSEHDFHLLRSKLIEFHGDRLLLDLTLPSRRDNSPLETLRYKYEDFLQRLLQKSLLQTSELLRIFLTEDGDFSLAVQASTLNATSTDLGNIYQTVAHRLRKEKGQHLETFLGNLLVSSDIERYQALKQGSARDVEEAQEMSEDIHVETNTNKRQRRVRNIHGTVFQNNFDMMPTVGSGDKEYQNYVVGFTECFMYLLIKVGRVRSVCVRVLGSLASVLRDLLDDLCERLLDRWLRRMLCERRLAHLVRLGHGLLFGRRTASPRGSAQACWERARRRLPAALWPALARVQAPAHNKQLIYNLLDLCIMELFPELSGVENNPSKLPKS